MRRAFALAGLALLALALPLAPFPGTAAEATPGELVIPDNESDVLTGPAPALAALSAGLDILEAKLFDEAGETLTLQIKVKDLDAENQLPTAVGNGVVAIACFVWGGTNFGIRLDYAFVQGALQYQTPNIGTVSGACGPAGLELGRKKPVPFDLDLENNVILFSISREHLGQLSDKPPPMPGETIGGVWTILRDGRGLRTDAAPDAAPHPEGLGLVLPTANQDLEMDPDVNVPISIDCGRSKNLRTYGVEAGGKRGVPIVVRNALQKDRPVNFSVEVEKSGGVAWSARIMPGITLPPATPQGPSNLTVNVILDTPENAKHKDCVTLVVRAADPASPLALGETRFNVVAVTPPTRQLNTLYFHAAAAATDACHQSGLWLNPLQSDPDDKKTPMKLLNCRAETPVSLANVQFFAYNDINPSHDLIVNTSASNAFAEATLHFKSDGPPTSAHIKIALVTGRLTYQVLGEGEARPDLTGAPSAVKIQIPIAFTREFVPTGDPSRRVETRDGLGFLVEYEPRPVDEAVGILRPAGVAYFLPEGSSVKLPIWATEKRNVVEPGKGGALLSIKALSPSEVLANPGKVRLLNFTLLNEGAAVDQGMVSVKIHGNQSWTAVVSPPGPHTLVPGVPFPFAVGVSPALGAAESESIVLDVVVTSQSDPTATAVASHKVVATEGQIFGDEAGGLLSGGASSKGGGLPGPSMGLFLLLVVPAALALRRRR